MQGADWPRPASNGMSHDPGRTLKIALYVVLSIVILVYALDKTKNLLLGPKIIIKSPLNGALIETSTVVLSGTAKNISKISVNGRPISIEQDGNFSQELVVPPGYTIISVTGTDRYGKEKEVTLELVRNSKESDEK